MLLAYAMLAFSGVVEGQVASNWIAEAWSLLLIACVIISNLYMLTSKTVLRFKIYFKFKKARDARIKRVKSKLNSLKKIKNKAKIK